MLALASANVGYASAFARTTTIKAVAEGVAPDFSDKPWTSSEISDAAGLKELAIKLNPVIGYWDPLNIGETSPETIGWFRQAEIKHGRVAMAAFVGYCIQANGIHWPWALQGPIGPLNSDLPTITFGDISAAGGPSDQWDALPSSAKLQILGAVGFLEMCGEASVFLEADGQQHYVRGGKPGYYPTLKDKFPHPIPFNLFDPFGLTSKMTPEKKEKSLLAEINNGRLAMLGLMSLIAEARVPGAVPALAGKIKKYDGDVMGPWSAKDANIMFVPEMIDFMHTGRIPEGVRSIAETV